MLSEGSLDALLMIPMLVIDNEEEDGFMNVTADVYSENKWWMGLTDQVSEGVWFWVDGSFPSYTNWHAGEPNDAGGNEDCAQLNRFGDDTWNDEPCSREFYYICESK